jgi:serine protease
MYRFGFVAALLSLSPALSMQDVRAEESAAPPNREVVTQLIVKVREMATRQSAHAGPSPEEARASLARRVVERALNEHSNAGNRSSRTRRSADSVIDVRPMSGAAYVVKLDTTFAGEAAEMLAQRVQAQPEVEYAEPDYLLHRQSAPTDPLYPVQWAYRDGIGAARFQTAWETTTGPSGIVIAVADTGYRPHPDLVANLLPGYDFLTNPFYANDGDGRDADASDPGDWVTAEDSQQCDGTDQWIDNSSWHGTHVAGTIGAVANNEIGGVGGVWHARILPVRVLGKCGGPVSDFVDGLRWAAGLSVPGVPDNPHRAKIVNVSLGTSLPCSRMMQAAVDDVLAQGVSVVAAAGNGWGEVGQPASCRGAIAVAAIDAKGNKWAASNAGRRIDLGAPGVDILSTANAGRTVPTQDNYASHDGSSMAAPHVSAAIALMLAVEPKLTPAGIRKKLMASARPYPDDSNCSKTTGTALCGAGMLDAAAAVAAARTTTAETAIE